MSFESHFCLAYDAFDSFDAGFFVTMRFLDAHVSDKLRELASRNDIENERSIFKCCPMEKRVPPKLRI